MNYLVITGSDKQDVNGSKQTVYTLGLLNERFEVAQSGLVLEQQVVQYAQNAKPINFSVENGKVVENNGKFERLKDVNGVSPRIILAEMVSPAGRPIGFIVCDKVGRVNKVRREDMMNYCKQAKAKGVSFVQNGIFRTTDGTDNIASYSGGEFIKFTVQPKKKMPEPKVAPHIEEARKAQAATPTQPTATPKAPSQASAKVEEKVKNSDRYSDAQKKELIAAKKNGVDPMIVSNPQLSPEQMRIIWVAKRNGMASEYFANPKFSEEQMQFFASRLTDKKMFMDCKGLINPKFNMDQLQELYSGVCDGVDISGFANPELSAEDMYVAHHKELASSFDTLAGNVDDEEGKHFLKAIRDLKKTREA